MTKAQLPGKAPSEEKKNHAGKTQKLFEQGQQAESPSLHQTATNLHQSTPQDMQILQRTVGNRAVQRLVGDKKHTVNDSTIIQRHVGDFAEPAGMVTDTLLTASAENAGRSLGAVMSAQSMFQSYRTMAESTPVPESQSTGSRGPGTSETGDQGEEIVM